MADFYNPYHFVPVKAGQAGSPGRISRKEFLDRRGNEHVTHERYLPKTQSGRLVVRLRTVTPTVVGGEQHPRKGKSTVVEPFMVDGKPAVAASTLRGLIGSLMEAVSNSAMRVLDDRTYSYRRAMDESLSAIGMIQREGNTLRLMPLTLPTLVSQDGGRSFPVPGRFRRIFPQPQFKVYFGDPQMIRSETFAHRTSTSPVPFPVRQLSYQGDRVLADRTLHVKGGKWAVAQDADRESPNRQGYIRVLGCMGARYENIPSGKKHELWLPAAAKGAKTIPILEEAIRRFHALADERTEESVKKGAQAEAVLPYHPLGSERNEDPTAHGEKFRLKHGDMVYFDVNEQGQVTELSLAAIWRGQVEDPATGKAATTYSFFRQLDKELLPFNPDREEITLAEQVLGFAEEMPEDWPAGERGALCLASRLRFGDAVLADNTDASVVFEPETPLKILSSPKPPSPAMYFKPKQAAASVVAKASLNPTHDAPQGRKVYLHHRWKTGEEPWRTKAPHESADQKCVVRPLKAGLDFFFCVDFDNLSDLELGLLHCALEPASGFHHKLGLGKPLGLGSVKLEVLAYLPVNRQVRYSLEGLRKTRYESVGVRSADTPVELPLRFREELPAGHLGDLGELTRVRKVFDDSGVMPAEVRRALELLGDYANAPLAGAVRYPTNVVKKSDESEHFHWFVANDREKQGRQSLRPIETTTQRLPHLREYAAGPPPGRRR